MFLRNTDNLDQNHDMSGNVFYLLVSYVSFEIFIYNRMHIVSIITLSFKQKLSLDLMHMILCLSHIKPHPLGI